VIHNSVPYGPIQGPGHGDPTFAKTADFMVISPLSSMHVIKRLMVNYDTPTQYPHFNWTDF